VVVIRQDELRYRRSICVYGLLFAFGGAPPICAVAPRLIALSATASICSLELSAAKNQLLVKLPPLIRQIDVNDWYRGLRAIRGRASCIACTCKPRHYGDSFSECSQQPKRFWLVERQPARAPRLFRDIVQRIWPAVALVRLFQFC
jgi:hypothetical protein